ncbi:hypothetical protein ACFQX6_01120 [Streptosporangium lutulentum]
MGAAEAERTVALVGAAWELFDEATADSPEELRRARAAVAGTGTRWSPT